MEPLVPLSLKAASGIDTPALLIDLDALERNIAKMARHFQGKSVRLRPHAKTHKCPEIARLQMEAGAIGVTCQKLGEAEALAEAGLDHILISNEVVDPAKIKRLVALAGKVDVMVAVDDPANVRALSDAASAEGVELKVLVEVNVGLNRCGVPPGEPALRLAQTVAASRGLVFEGLMGYEGHTVFVKSLPERRRLCSQAVASLVATKELLEARGLAVPVVSGGGTGTYMITGEYPGVTEIQPGSYVFMDATYATVEGVDFEQSLTVLSTVISRPTPERAVIDAGLKSLSTDMGPPKVKGLQGAELTRLSEEHGILRLEGEAQRLKPGDRVELLPSHCCTTVNLFDRYHCVRNGSLDKIWAIAARGKSQ
ncbi:MAG: DSD1 family PLP-dependent enzyme [Candidatus Bathyarchaeia archaeon]